MTETLAIGSTVLFALTGVILGPRFLVAGGRNRNRPELSLGLALISIAVIGYPLVVIGMVMTTDASRFLLASGTGMLWFGWSCLWVFTYTVFRPDAGWARGVVTAAITLSLAATIWRVVRLLGEDLESLQQPTVDALATQAMALILYLWISVESIHHHVLGVRRTRFGLADPVVTNRFLLFAVMGFFSLVSLVPPFVLSLFPSLGSISAARVVTGFAGTVCAVSLYLAFLPPRWYAGWLQKGSSPSAAASAH